MVKKCLLIKVLIDLMPKRYAAIISANGYVMKYLKNI